MPRKNPIAAATAITDLDALFDEIKKEGICLETLFNRIQNLKYFHNSKIVIKSFQKAAFEKTYNKKGFLEPNTHGAKFKLEYFFHHLINTEEITFEEFLLINN
ncbi:hypothetical protein MG290_02860 [Flavobacterium sp. CBA20B-1]|uniref:hypothetical protein n=1 Tax=unclassified Flavobacterium TaxID=196869 RepID=UPI00222520BE|nr:MULTISPECIES: hypothetical protein [unclassified Flavobacterium]WCM42632.1 hypothetical protein MG290_02860 [Flavobacterium sp. CBA20B-1]